MKASGYTKKFRYQIVHSALTAYDKIIKAYEEGKRPLYRTREWRNKEKSDDGRMKKVNWYQKGNWESIIFIPATPNSVLKKEMESKIRQTNIKIKVVEKAGTSLKRLLQKSDPFRKNGCEERN